MYVCVWSGFGLERWERKSAQERHCLALSSGLCEGLKTQPPRNSQIKDFF